MGMPPEAQTMRQNSRIDPPAPQNLKSMPLNRRK
jgi:hypothetical protein